MTLNQERKLAGTLGLIIVPIMFFLMYSLMPPGVPLFPSYHGKIAGPSTAHRK